MPLNEMVMKCCHLSLRLAEDAVSGSNQRMLCSQFFCVFGNRMCLRALILLELPNPLCNVWMVGNLSVAIGMIARAVFSISASGPS